MSPHNRQHLHFFLAAGLANVAWLPNLTCDANIVARPAPPTRSLTAVGSGHIGRFHPARLRLVERLKRSGIPYEHVLGRAADAAEAYARATVSVNCSLNGDLNLRVSEVLASGGCLVTDALSPQAGLELLFEPDRDIVTYRTEEEAVGVTRDLLSHPERAAGIAECGWKKLSGQLSFEAQSRRLIELIERGSVHATFDLRREPRCTEDRVDDRRLEERLSFYERAQELNRTRPRTTIGFAADVHISTVLDVVDLHRTSVVVEHGRTAALLRDLAGFDQIRSQVEVRDTTAFRASSYDLLVGSTAGSPPDTRAPRGATLREDAATTPAALCGPTDHLCAANSMSGTADLGHNGAWANVAPFRRDLQVTVPREARDEAHVALCRDLLRQLTPVHEALARAELARGNSANAVLVVSAAIAVDPDAPSLRRLATKACLHARRPNEAGVHAREAVRLAPASPESWDALAATAYVSADWAGAERALRRALAIEPKATRWGGLATILERQQDHMGASLGLVHQLLNANSSLLGAIT